MPATTLARLRAAAPRAALPRSCRGAPLRPAAVAPRRAVAVRASEKPGAESAPAAVNPKASTTGPAPQKFNVADGQLGDIIGSALPLVMRAGSGALVSGWRASIVPDEGETGYTFATFNGQRIKETSKIPEFNRPEKPLEIYEFEACPFCKKVREAVSILDLDVIFYPCPKDGTTWRPKANELGGKKMFPYMVDPNSGTAMYESDDIIQYLFKTYGDGKVPLFLNLGPITTITAGLGQVARATKGAQGRLSNIPEQPVVLWGYEGSPFVKVVREVLCELEIPYLLKSCARGSATRNEMLEKVGHFQVPFLEDPNTKESMFESAYIVDYLEKTYAK